LEEVAQDPKGATVVLTDDCWQHITANHPEMLSFRTYVLETIRVPDGIYKGRRDPTRKIYRKTYAQVPGLGNALDLLVFVAEESGYIATAYFCAMSFRMLGAMVWPSS
jgi:hypothetical protein